MDIDVVDNPEAGRFEIHVDGRRAGFTTYKRGEKTVSFLHTEIEPAYEGQGLGSRLVRTALDAAREEGLVVAPYCPFVRSYIERHADYHDLLADGFASTSEAAPTCEPRPRLAPGQRRAV